MQIPSEISDKVINFYRQLTGVSLKWIVSLLCLVSIALIGFFSNHYQARSSIGIIVTESEGVQPSEVKMSQSNVLPNSPINHAAMPTIWPTSGEVTSRFGWRSSPWGDGREMHSGIDIANSFGTPIYATADGEVVQSGWAGGYGNIVQIHHGNGIETIYGHNSRVIAAVGQTVKKGQVIAYLGSTGRSTGPHLHYEIRVNGTAVDPISYLVL